MRTLSLIVPAAAVLLAGCSGAATPEDLQPAETAGAASGETEPSPGGKPPVSIDRSSMAGDWLLVQPAVVENRGGSVPHVLEGPFAAVSIEKTPDGAFEIQKTLVAPAATGVTIEAASIEETTIHLKLKLKTPQGVVERHFRGKLAGGDVPGAQFDSSGLCLPARLVPVAEATEGVFGEPWPLPGVEELFEAVQAFAENSDVEPLLKFLKEHPRNPLAAHPLVLNQIGRIVQATGREKLDRSKLRELCTALVAQAERWGSRLAAFSRVELGTALLVSFHPEEALELLQGAENSLPEDAPAAWRAQIAVAVRNAEFQRNLDRMVTGSGEEKSQAKRALESVIEQEPFNFLALYALARDAADSGDVDAAIGLFSRLAALPGLNAQLPHLWKLLFPKQPAPPDAKAELKRLWRQKHGDLQRLDEHLARSYESTLSRLGEEPLSAGAKDAVLFCELFTSTHTHSSLPAELALAALSRAGGDRVVALRYHLHSAGSESAEKAPNPLANPDAEARAQVYGLSHPPALIFAGRYFRNIEAIQIQQTGELYQRLRSDAEKMLANDPPVTVRLDARRQGEEISVAAEVEGPSSAISDSRLVVALAQSRVQYEGPNELARHEMVVCSMPTGADGVAPSGGTLRFEKVLRLEDIRQRLGDYLGAYAESHEVQFDRVPLDLRELHVVAFVQRPRTGEVLHAAAVRLEPSADAKPPAPQ